MIVIIVYLQIIKFIVQNTVKLNFKNSSSALVRK